MNELQKQSWKNHKKDAPVEATIYRDTVDLHDNLAQGTLAIGIRMQEKINSMEDLISRAERSLYRMASGHPFDQE